MSAIEPTPEPPQAEPAPTVDRRPVRWYDLAIAAFFGLIFAYLVWTAIGNAINLPAYSGQPDALPWWLFFVAIATPIIIYVIAFIISMRYPPLVTALVFLMALGAASALGYSAMGIFKYVLEHVSSAI